MHWNLKTVNLSLLEVLTGKRLTISTNVPSNSARNSLMMSRLKVHLSLKFRKFSSSILPPTAEMWCPDRQLKADLAGVEVSLGFNLPRPSCCSDVIKHTDMTGRCFLFALTPSILFMRRQRRESHQLVEDIVTFANIKHYRSDVGNIRLSSIHINFIVKEA